MFCSSASYATSAYTDNDKNGYVYPNWNYALIYFPKAPFAKGHSFFTLFIYAKFEVLSAAFLRIQFFRNVSCGEQVLAFDLQGQAVQHDSHCVIFMIKERRNYEASGTIGPRMQCHISQYITSSYRFIRVTKRAVKIVWD